MTVRLVLMGVAGCGKSSVGAALAPRLGAVYVDGDDLHSPENVEKMRAGTPLTDADRWPWLGRIGETLRDPGIVIGCSALRRIYRDRIREMAGAPVRFVHLTGSRDVIAARMGKRTGHYMPTTLLDSQFATLEIPGPDEAAIAVDIDQPLDAIVAAILAALPATQ
ncbi:gluconokinase [Szabonella alba]|uniref:Gluconokinase n=1 Tax=Szabonella alba TaxID=2804194 RepID=A0A8K0VCK6_9RHOB|nr:gluconokinase [Szabonella alba]MBL4916812.1 gluconokinase [Szabonella alba]